GQFFYLTGVVEPRAVVVIDGRSKHTTLFLLPPVPQRERSMYGPGLAIADAVKTTGVDEVRPRTEFTDAMTALAADRRAIYTPFGAEVLGSQSSGDPTRRWTANRQDPGDGRDAREHTFLA